ncbi:pyridoxamine 5'-phosphate oxidase-domain-containing protein [Hygrophoropsis aurantiaca]|uniref:Pyridoxamine 5'-phosphate oxidase-domain-containing protein n=1 Tax=Hygrophoropsis aurantiaca TaxID=72124 RepID=A0ACB8AES9_9AGAM|nr:pyridoxamine 5'-phosphate oxidase-domain-containing protein [Hygrophoropsis aurantiaca]
MAHSPRWLSALSNAMDKESKSIVFQLATIDDHQPRVRSCILRETLTAPKYPITRPLLLTTTDIRTPKVSQMKSNPQVEAVFWTESTQEQFRIAGRGLLFPSSDDTKEKCQADLSALMGAGHHDPHFDWEAKRISVFNSLGSHMRAAWARPPPGTLLSNPTEDPKAWPQRVKKVGEAETDQEKRDVEFALENFALLMIEPAEVDWVELGPDPQRRTNASWLGDGWEERAVVP